MGGGGGYVGVGAVGGGFWVGGIQVDDVAGAGAVADSV